MSTAQDIIDRARRLINDEVSAFASSVQWSDDEILQWITDAQTQVVTLKPEANAVTQLLEPTIGRPRQNLSIADAIKLIRVEANGQATPDECLCSVEPAESGTVIGYFLESQSQIGFGSYDATLVELVDGATTTTLAANDLLISEVSSDAGSTGFFVLELGSLDTGLEVPQISSVTVTDCEADSEVVFSIDDPEVFDADGSTGVDNDRTPPIAFRLYRWSIESDVLQSGRCYELSIVLRELN